MKKALKILVKVIIGLVLLILIALFTVPVLFKDKIRTEVENVINGSVNAKVVFDDYSLSFFRNFPNLSFSLDGLSVTGTERFEGDTLAAFRSFSLVFNLASLFGDSGYEVKSVILNRAVLNAIVLEDGTANWDIVKETGEVEEETIESDTSSSDIKVALKRFAILDTDISYTDAASKMSAYLKNLNYNLSGDMTLSTTDLDMTLSIAAVSFIMDGVRYLNKAVIDSRIGLKADLDNMKFEFAENFFSLNELKLNFSGMVAMPGDDIETDVSFGTDQTSFKTLLSMVPAIYMEGYEQLVAMGEFSLAGTAKGIYSEADSTLPDVTVNLAVTNGLISYPDLPEKITNINIKAGANVDGTNIDGTTASVDQFHFELAGSPFDMNFSVKTPISDPDFKAMMKGKIDLVALTKAVPIDSISLSGIIDMSMTMAGKLSMIEKEEYESFQALGSVNIKGMSVNMTGYPEVRIDDAGFEFSPAWTTMTSGRIGVGNKSDFNITGRLENYIPYVFRNETIKGQLSLNSENVDLTDIMSQMISDTTTVEEDTAALAVIRIPDNIDFSFNTLIKNFAYDNIKAQNIKGNLAVRGGVLSIRETGLEILGGTIVMNADYDTRDSLKPVMKADFNMKNIGVKDAFTTFNTVQKLVPAAKGIDGRINLQLNYESLLGNDMMPLLNTVNGGGKLQSDEITLVESAAYDKIKEVLKLGDKYSNTFRDLNVSFKINNGRIYVNPFDTKVGNIKMNISGDQGLDQTLNYLIKTEIPRADLGSSVNSLIDNLSAQASSLGIAYKPADVLKVNVKVTGVFGKPVVMPVFGAEGSGSAAASLKETAKETVKETISNVVDTGKDKLRQEAEIQGDKLIEEAEARGQQLREEAAKAAEKIRQEADAQAQKLIEGAASKGVIAKAAAQKGADALKNEATKRADQLVKEADVQAEKLLNEAKAKKEEMVNKI
jgi:hypothetical protein